MISHHRMLPRRLTVALALVLGLVVVGCDSSQPDRPATATLPEGAEEFTLGDMARGQRAYTVPWGMWVDKDRRCWLNPDYPAETAVGGTGEMPVHRLADGTFEVDIRGLDEQWTPKDNPGYVGQDGPWLEVSKVLS